MKSTKLMDLLSENKNYPQDKIMWNNMSKEQQNQLIDKINQDLISGSPLSKNDKWKDYDNLNSDFYEELHSYLYYYGKYFSNK